MVLSKHRPEAGFSLIEVLIAAGLLMMISIGLIPLFTNSIVSNVKGQESTTVSNMAKSKVEELMRLPFDAPELTIAGGVSELETKEFWSIEEKVWKPGEPAVAGEGSWIRTTTVRQYNVQDLTDGTAILDNPLDGNTAVTMVQIKGIQVKLENVRQGGPLGEGRELTLNVFKPF